MRSVFQNHELFEKTYFKKFPGFYVTGDGESLNMRHTFYIKAKSIMLSPIKIENSERGEMEKWIVGIMQLFPPPFLSGCRRDKDGYYWITGRIDDMLNVSGAVA